MDFIFYNQTLVELSCYIFVTTECLRLVANQIGFLHKNSVNKATNLCIQFPNTEF